DSSFASGRPFPDGISPSSRLGFPRRTAVICEGDCCNSGSLRLRPSCAPSQNSDIPVHPQKTNHNGTNPPQPAKPNLGLQSPAVSHVRLRLPSMTSSRKSVRIEAEPRRQCVPRRSLGTRRNACIHTSIKRIKLVARYHTHSLIPFAPVV